MSFCEIFVLKECSFLCLFFLVVEVVIGECTDSEGGWSASLVAIEGFLSLVAIGGLSLVAIGGLSLVAIGGFLSLVAIGGLSLVAIGGLSLVAIEGFLSLVAIGGLSLVAIGGLSLVAIGGLSLVTIEGLSLVAIGGLSLGVPLEPVAIEGLSLGVPLESVAVCPLFVVFSDPPRSNSLLHFTTSIPDTSSKGNLVSNNCPCTVPALFRVLTSDPFFLLFLLRFLPPVSVTGFPLEDTIIALRLHSSSEDDASLAILAE